MKEEATALSELAVRWSRKWDATEDGGAFNRHCPPVSSSHDMRASRHCTLAARGNWSPCNTGLLRQEEEGREERIKGVGSYVTRECGPAVATRSFQHVVNGKTARQMSALRVEAMRQVVSKQESSLQLMHFEALKAQHSCSQAKPFIFLSVSSTSMRRTEGVVPGGNIAVRSLPQTAVTDVISAGGGGGGCGNRTSPKSCMRGREDSVVPRGVRGATIRAAAPPLRHSQVNMEQRRNEGMGITGDPRENPPTNGIVRHDSHSRKSGDPAGD
ncbi:hypothetical protein PR048_022110 [Dryococelus australis]|uniref:Uncharacterized protein n=1 Tax=Dryococelus australis TaxID=614101 RepID=A0ABQ9H063_9NEOP|nr:hypothetical protein PR048_022110 [Dryococelus australis]